MASKILNLVARLTFQETGAQKVARQSKEMRKELERAQAASDRINQKLAATQTGKGALGAAGISGTDYRGMRGLTGARQASGKNFSGVAGIADGGGGRGGGVGGTLVGAYATLAANVFALSAAFQALSQAARVEQLTQGLELMGARGGTALKLTAQNLKEVTDNAISTADAMRAVAQASSAGLGSDEIARLGAVARGAGLALGRDLSESMDRLTRGAIKLEPELLDELGIMVRLDEAVKQYAIENQKAASSLTLTERRQAFLNAVLEEGERKFGDISKNIKANPYDKLAAAARDLATAFANILNFGLKPIAEIFSNNPFLLLIPGLFLVKKALEGLGYQFIGLGPIIQQNVAKSIASMDKFALKTGKVLKVFKDGVTPLGGFMTALGTSTGQVAAVFDRMDTSATQSIKQLKAQMRVAQAEVQVLSGRFTLLDRAVLKVAKTTLLFGIRLKILGSIITSTVALAASLVAAMLPMIGITAAFYAVAQLGKFFKRLSDRAKGLSPEVKKVTSDLEKLAESSKQVGEEIEKSMKIRDYSTAYQAAIKNIGELITMLEKLKRAQDDAAAYFQGEEDKLTSRVPLTLGQTFSLSNIFRRDNLGAGTMSLGESLGLGKEETQAVEQTLSRISFLRGEATAEGIRDAIKAGEDYLSLLKTEYDSLKALESSWSNIADGAKKAGQAIDKFYGPAFTKTNYSDVADSIKLIQQEITAIGTAGFSVEATVGAFDELRKGGASLAAELDSLSSEDSVFFTQAFETASRLQAELRAEEKKGQGADQQFIETKKAALANLASEVLGAIQDGELAALSAARNIEQFVLEKRIEVLKLAENLQKVEKSIAGELRKQQDIQTKINNLERFGAADAPNKTLQLEQELDTAREKARIEAASLTARQAVVDAEFQLEQYKLRAARRNLRSSAAAQIQGNIQQRFGRFPGMDNTMSGFAIATEAARTEEPIITEQQLREYLQSAGIRFPEESIGSLLDLVDATRTYNTILEQGAEINQRVSAETQAKINTLGDETRLAEALLNVYLNDINVKLRQIQVDKQMLDIKQKFLTTENKIADATTRANRLRRETALISRGLATSESTNIQNRIDDLDTEAARIEQNADLALERSLIEANRLKRLKDQQTDIANDESRTEAVRQEARDKAASFAVEIQTLAESNLLSEREKLAILESISAERAKELGLLEEQTLQQRLLRAEESARAGAQLASAGFGMSIAGGGDIFSGLVREEATASERSVAEVLADPETVGQIKKTTLAIRENQIVSEGLANIAGEISSGMTEAFMAMIDGSKSAGEAFKNMAKAILQQIMQIIMQLLVVKALQAAGIPIPGAGGGIIPTENGAGGGMIKKYATGGIVGPRDGLAGVVSRPTYLIGEGRMNEAVVPLPNGRAIPVQMHGGNSQQNNVSVNVNVSNEGKVSTETQGNDMQNLGAVIATAVQKELIAQKMPGGILNRYGAA